MSHVSRGHQYRPNRTGSGGVRQPEYEYSKDHEQQAIRFKLDVRPHGEPRIRCQGRGEAPHQPGQNEGQTVNQNLFTAGLNGHSCLLGR
jgi:hypothetical protein